MPETLTNLIAHLMDERRKELAERYERSPLYLECVIREHDATCAKLGHLLIAECQR